MTLNNIPKIKKIAVAAKDKNISTEGITQFWKGAKKIPVKVTEIAVISDINVDGIPGSSFFVVKSLKTINLSFVMKNLYLKHEFNDLNWFFNLLNSSL